MAAEKAAAESFLGAQGPPGNPRPEISPGMAPTPLRLPSLLGRRRLWLALATPIPHGALAGPATVCGEGPSLPADTAITMPAARARNIAALSLLLARSSAYGSEASPPIEKLITST